MLPERWQRLQTLFEAAADLPVAERQGYLDRECAGEPELRREVEELLAAEGDEADPIESAIRHVAGEISDEADSPAAGGRIGPYEIVEPLGRGGMGSVFLARRVDEAYDKRVAIKLIRGGPHDPEQLLRFRMERQILANLDHPHIARVLDGGTTDDGDPFVVMEYVPGEPIDRYCDRYGLSVRRRVELFITVCDAVQCAHRNLVVHRDLKPSNILVNQVGEVKLLDFGIAKMLDPAQVPHTVVETRSAVRMMTPEFAAPEQVRGEPVTTATDVYALGVLLYQLLSGARPYRLESYRPQEIERVVCESQPVRPSAAVGRAAGGAGSSEHEPLDRTHGSPADRVRRELAGDLDNIVLKALRKEPARRYASAEQLAGDLRRFLEGRPVEARPDTWRYRSSKFLRRHVWSVSAGALFVVVLIAFAVTMTIQAARVTRQRDAAALERSRAERVASFLLDVFEVANPEENRGETVTARELVDRGAARVREELKDDPELLSEFLNTIGDVYTKLALYDRAAELLEESVTACRVGYGPTAPECAKSLNNLGMVQQQLGDYDAAERSIRAGLELVEAAHGEEHVDTIASLNNLARVQQAKGDFAAAEATYRRCLELCDRIGEGGVGLAIQLDNLGQLLDAAGRPGEAEPLLRRSLELSVAAEGKDSARVAVTLNTLGGVEFGLGNLEESEALYRRSLAISTRIYGPDHPETMTTRNNLALVLDDRGDLAGAETELRAVLGATRHALGDEHPEVATVMGNLAGVLRREGKMDEAEGYYRDALAMSRRTLGDNHLDVGIRLNNLARFLQDAGRPAEAVEAYRRCLEIIESNVGRDHPYYPAALGNLALALKDAGRGDEAVTTATRALELRQAADGEQSRSAADGMTTLAETLIAVGRNDEAERRLERAVAVYREVMPEGHPRIARALGGLGRLYLDEGRADDAEPLLREALEIRSRAMTEGVDLAESQLDLGDCLAVLGRQAEAATLLRQGIATLAPARGGDDGRIAEARARLAQIP